MKKRVVLVLAVLLVAMAVIVIGVSRKGKAQEEKAEVISILVGSMLASYEDIDRELTVDYFYHLDADMTYEEIEREIGRPNGAVGSGITIPYYKVGSQYVVIQFCRDTDGNYTNIMWMKIYTSDAYEGEIPLKE